jgi:DNA recombination protein RmuC
MVLRPMVVGLLIGLVIGAGGVWLLLRTKQAELASRFDALAADALRKNNETFLDLAAGKLEQKEQAVEDLVAPIKDSLGKVGEKLQQLEVARAGAYSALTTQVGELTRTQAELRSETGNLVSALRDRPNVRGRWGEIQLRRVVEMAGMLEHCDFETQHHVATEEGRIRPDLVVKLPGGGSLVVDAKFVAQAYLESLDARDEDERAAKLRDHARQLRDQLTKLAAKNYWAQFDRSPDYVVLFIPGQHFLDAALERDPTLIEDGIARRVLIATPINLIGLLRTSALIWREETIAESAKELSALGTELYERLAKFTTHIVGIGRGIESAAKSFNGAVGSFQDRVLPSARKFKEHGVAPSAEIAELKVVETAIRPVTAPELPPASADAA